MIVATIIEGHRRATFGGEPTRDRRLLAVRKCSSETGGQWRVNGGGGPARRVVARELGPADLWRTASLISSADAGVRLDILFGVCQA
jgi:hypothetical protein